ncbi:MAG: histidine kinase N-terminal 7TM domain-containing protein, partial [Thiobacillus sp.]
MQFFVSPITLIFLFNATLLLILGSFLFFNQKSKYVLFYSIIMYLIALWALFSAAEIGSLTVDLRILFSKLEFISVVAIGPLWLMFSMYYAEIDTKRYKYLKYILLFMYFSLISLVFTNEIHHLVWTGYSQIGSNITDGLVFEH